VWLIAQLIVAPRWIVKNLTNSIFLLLAYLFLVLGLAQIRYFERHVLYFQAAFFIIMTFAVFSGIVPFRRFRMPLYAFLAFWAIIYVLIWQVYWRTLVSPPDPSEVAIQFLLAEVAAGLAHNVGSNLAEFNALFENLSANVYPNRTLEMKSAGDRIQTEMTRSRRYSRPLSVLIVKLDESPKDKIKLRLERLEQDLFRRLALAKVGQIINGHARQTDLIMRDEAGQFVILCPETEATECGILAERIEEAVEEDLGDKLEWGIASFPQETLEFGDLLSKAKQRLRENTGLLGKLEEEPVEDVAGYVGK
jgi:GGDEF domain-containing protein